MSHGLTDRSPDAGHDAVPLQSTQLQMLHAVVGQGSVTAAAGVLGYTQPAVTHGIRRLERDVGVALLARRGRGVVPTAAGRRLAAHAETVLAVMAAARREMADIAAVRSGTVRLAVFPSAAATLAAEVLAWTDTHAAGLSVSLVHAEPDTALPMVRSGRVDVALSFDFPGTGGATDDRALACHVLGDDPLRVVLRGDDPALVRRGDEQAGLDAEAASGRVMRLGDLAERRWIAGCPRCRVHLVSACAAAGFTPRIAHATDDYVAVQTLVARGLGVTLLPALALRAHRRGDVAVRAVRSTPAAAPVSRRVVAHHLRVDPTPPTVAAVLAALDAAWLTTGPSAGPPTQTGVDQRSN